MFNNFGILKSLSARINSAFLNSCNAVNRGDRLKQYGLAEEARLDSKGISSINRLFKEVECKTPMTPSQHKIEPMPEACKPPQGPIYNETCPRPFQEPCKKSDLVDTCSAPDPLPPLVNKRLQGDNIDPLNMKNTRRFFYCSLMLSVWITYKSLMKLVNAPKEIVSFSGYSRGPLVKRPQAIEKEPGGSSAFPPEVPYIIVGGGVAGYAASQAIKSRDENAKVLMFTNEAYYPYLRPPLSKHMITTKDRKLTKNFSYTQWDGTDQSIYCQPESSYTPAEELEASDTGGVTVARGWNVVALNPTNKTVTLDDGRPIKYGKCLIATGSTPRNLSVFSCGTDKLQERVTLYKGLFDFLELEDLIDRGMKEIAVVGGGFNGTELAASLCTRGLEVTHIFREPGVLYDIIPYYLSEHLTSQMKDLGVKVLPNTTVEDATGSRFGAALITNKEEQVFVDHIIVAVGSDPNVDLAKTSRLEIDKKLNGIKVNCELLARSDLYVAGDCASFFDPLLGRRRMEHFDHALETGRLAGENMTGAKKCFQKQSSFWSELSQNLKLEAIGLVDSTMSTVGIFYEGDDPEKDGQKIECHDSTEEKKKVNFTYKKGIVFYLKDDDQIAGVLLWNVSNKMTIARQVLHGRFHYKDLDDVVRLFNIHEPEKKLQAELN